MKTFYTVNYVTDIYDENERWIRSFTSIESVESSLFDAYQFIANLDDDTGYTIRRFVEYYELNPNTNSYEPVTEERSVVYFPNTLTPTIDPWNISPF